MDLCIIEKDDERKREAQSALGEWRKESGRGCGCGWSPLRDVMSLVHPPLPSGGEVDGNVEISR